MRLQNSGRLQPEKKSFEGSSSGDSAEKRLAQALFNDEIDFKFGFHRHKDPTELLGYLINIHPTEILNDDKRLIAAVDYYFLQENGSRFKVSLPFEPYFYIATKPDTEQELITFLNRRFQGSISNCVLVRKEDLDLPNHLTGLKRTYIKLSFLSSNDMQKVRREILPIVRKNAESQKSSAAHNIVASIGQKAAQEKTKSVRIMSEHLDSIVDIREHDVPYHVRVSIDLKLFVGKWYAVRGQGNQAPLITSRDDILLTPDVSVLAYDIETTKGELKFPDAGIDSIMMISYMIDGKGYLITNREVVAQDVEDFEYTPKPEFEGMFTIFNEANELALLQRFFDHVIETKPLVISTYNGDNFDWMFVEARAAVHGLNMEKEVGYARGRDGYYLSRASIHMDCLHWVKRDSYLPVGSQNLKAVAKAKLRYDPVELDPELMCLMAANQPQVLANYSVSDAVATYYLYMKYVHPFIFALCTIIPMQPDEVLRKGSGTLCESLLMVQAFHANIVFPNKQEAIYNKLSAEGHVLDSETYVGGHVEALESGVFRSDLPCRFRLVPEAFEKLIENVEATIRHAVEVEEKIPVDQVTNFDEICDSIKKSLASLRDCPNRLENPIIYHLDVGAMYPNIILTNRLQPSAIVDESVCGMCSFNKFGAECQRVLPWTWRGELMPASQGEFERIKQQLEMEMFPPEVPGGPQRIFHELPKDERAAVEKKRLAEYCRKAYKKTHVTRIETRYTTVCQRENSFYVDTVRNFRDRRYQFKALLKVAKKKVSEAVESGDVQEIKASKNLEVLYDSLQLAHKCILNSFYGYVMRKGARWYSMEMAGIVCHTGAGIITKARELVEQVGRPLELDTDGIWCVLPASFPENYQILTTNPKKPKITISYPGAVLNLLVQEHNTNDQYHELVNPETHEYQVRSENSIFFEVDGPYLAMILPASKEEGKKLKKRYAVFNFDKSLAELKGFEVKRRGELQLIKVFQSSVFEAFLKGQTLEECYAAVAKIADYWLDVLYSKASNMPNEELFELISENRNMSRKLEDYGSQKSTSISTAKRLAEFLGDQMVKDAGLSCRYIIAKKPEGAPVTERAIPLAIFKTEWPVARNYLRKWLKTWNEEFIIVDGERTADIREIVDWSYYIERLGSAIQKIITIPATMQGVANPVPRVAHPPWLHKRLLEKNDKLKQKRINEMFSILPKRLDGNDSDENNAESPTVPDASADLFDGPDIEGDIPNRAPNAPIIANCKKRVRAPSADEDVLSKNWREVLGHPPPFGTTDDEFDEWLAFHKKKWVHQAKQRQRNVQHLKKSKTATAEVSTGVGRSRKFQAGGATIGAFLRKAQRSLLNSPWQIIEIEPTTKASYFKLWALVGNELHQVIVFVPRIFYANLLTPKLDNAYESRKVARYLPHSHIVHNLYEYSIDEDVFNNRYEDIMAEIASPQVAGIYETQVPPIFRLIAHLGCVCKLSKHHYHQYANTESDVFDFRHLEMTSASYIGSGNIKYVFLYQHTEGNKQMWALFVPKWKQGFLCAVDTVDTNQMPNASNLFTHERQRALEKGMTPETIPEEGYTFEVKVYSKDFLAHRFVQRYLSQYHGERNGPTVLIIQSALETEDLKMSMPVLSDFPLMRLHVAEAQTVFQALNWQSLGTKSIIRHYINLETLLNIQLEKCRYYEIPLGNLPAADGMFALDLLYARQLYKNNVLWWCSRDKKPDLGGKEMDENRAVLEFEKGCNELVLNREGAYSNVCVDFALANMPIATIIQATALAELEGVSAAVAFEVGQLNSLEEILKSGGAAPSVATSYDQSAQCMQAFRILKTTVAHLLRDVSVQGSTHAENAIAHIMGWLKTPQCLFYDPAITALFNNFLKKFFTQLLSEVERLGGSIVYANKNRLIVCTKRRQVDDAMAYVQFLVENMRNKELFHAIELIPQGYWSYLLWMEPFNYGGATEQTNEESVVEDSMVAAADNDVDGASPLPPATPKVSVTLQIMWNLAEYLPSMVKDCFESAISSFIGDSYKFYHSAPDEVTFVKPSQDTGDFKMHNDSAVEPAGHRQEYLCKEVLGSLLRMTQKINAKCPSNVLNGENVFPKLPGSHLNMTNPALEFIKAVCRVLSVDEELRDLVQCRVRRSLLKLINVGEFSPQAEWVDPCMSFTLTEVICSGCQHCRDIDLCKDPYQIEYEKDVPKWICPNCKQPYKSSYIEAIIEDYLEACCISYIVQDLVCVKCRMVKRGNMSRRCECAGEFETMIPEKRIISTIKMFSNIANFYFLGSLHSKLQWYQEQCGIQVENQ